MTTDNLLWEKEKREKNEQHELLSASSPESEALQCCNDFSMIIGSDESSGGGALRSYSLSVIQT